MILSHLPHLATYYELPKVLLTSYVGWGFVLARSSNRLLLYPHVTLLVVCVRSNPEAVCNLLYLLYHRRCQWCVCVLSAPWWSGLAEP